MEHHGSSRTVLFAVAATGIIDWDLVWEAWKVQNGPGDRDQSVIGVC